jgi:hypothetical protein
MNPILMDESSIDGGKAWPLKITTIPTLPTIKRKVIRMHRHPVTTPIPASDYLPSTENPPWYGRHPEKCLFAQLEQEAEHRANGG